MRISGTKQSGVGEWQRSRVKDEIFTVNLPLYRLPNRCSGEGPVHPRVREFTSL